MPEAILNTRDLQKAIVVSGLPLPRFGIDGRCGSETLSAAQRLFASAFGGSRVSLACGTGSLSWAVLVSGSQGDVGDVAWAVGDMAGNYNPAVHGTGRVAGSPIRPLPRPPEAGGTEPIVPPTEQEPIGPVEPGAPREVSWVPLAVVGVGVVGLVAYMMWGK